MGKLITLEKNIIVEKSIAERICMHHCREDHYGGKVHHCGEVQYLLSELCISFADFKKYPNSTGTVIKIFNKNFRAEFFPP